MAKRRPQVEGQGKFEAAFFARRIDFAGGVAVVLKPRQPPRFGLVGIDRFCFVSASAGMGDMIDAAAQRQAIPSIDNIERQRRMYRNGTPPSSNSAFLRSAGSIMAVSRWNCARRWSPGM